MVRRRFFWSMLAVAALVLLIIFGASALASQRAEERALINEMGRSAAVIGQLLQERYSAEDGVPARRFLAALRDDEVPLGDLLDNARRLAGGGAVDVGVILPTGRLETRSGLGERLDFDTGALSEGENQLVRTQQLGVGRSMLVLAHPGGQVGSDGPILVVLVARNSPTIDWGDLLGRLVVPLLVAAVVAALAARLLSGWLQRRLGELDEAARALAGGDLAARAPEQGDDEIADVARAFNEMAARLQSTHEREREFLMSVGHDLRTPLTTIGGYAEALEEGVLDEADTRRAAGVLSAETSRLRRLVEDLMLLAQLEAREFTLRPEPVDVAAHLREVAEGFRPRADAARVRLAVAIEETGLRHVDPDRLAQVAGNLLENALRYTPEAGEVTLAVRPADAGLEIAVSDTGPGIDAADLPHVFEKFYVARKYRREHPEGSGLGLSIVRRLVDAMPGDVQVASAPGEGTTVTVVLEGPPLAS